MPLFIDILQNFAVSFGFVTVALLLLWLIGLKIKDASIIDMFWGAGFVDIAILCVLTQLYFKGSGFIWQMWTPYMMLFAALPVVWGLRLSGYLIWRNWGHGEDARYTELRTHVSEKQWPLYVLKAVFIDQGVGMLLVAAPIYVAIAGAIIKKAPDIAPYALPDGTMVHAASTIYATPIGIFAIIGALVWLVGFLFEFIADIQLARFKARLAKMDIQPSHYDPRSVLQSGLWKYSRHPNYFGNALVWWGIWLVACQVPWGWVTIISPLFMTYALLKLTGVPVLEEKLGSRPAYADYMTRTSPFIPLPPKG